MTEPTPDRDRKPLDFAIDMYVPNTKVLQAVRAGRKRLQLLMKKLFDLVSGPTSKAVDDC